VNAYLQILADAVTACALFAIGLGVSIDGLRANIGRSAALAAIKVGLMPLIVLGVSIALRLEPLYLTAAVVCAAVPTAKTVYILSREYHCEESHDSSYIGPGAQRDLMISGFENQRANSPRAKDKRLKPCAALVRLGSPA